MNSDHLENRHSANKAKFHDTYSSSMADNREEKFLFEKSLVQGIKENNVGKILDLGQEGGDIDLKQIYNQEKQVKTLFVEIRKRYDDAKAAVVKKEKQISKYQKSLEELKLQEQKYLNIEATAKSNLENLVSKLHKLQEMLEFSIFDKDIYLQMQQKIKNDILFYKKNSLTVDTNLNKDRVRLKSLRSNAYNKSRLSSRCKTILDTMETTVYQKEKFRSTKIQSFYDVLNKKEENSIKKQLREKEIQEVMMSAMTDKLQEEKEWEKILSVNLFLKKMLKRKMQRVIEQSHETETIFHKIRQETSVTDSSDFINKFINREKNYGTLLENIAEKEGILAREKQTKEELEAESTKLQEEQGLIEDLEKEKKVIPLHSKQEIETYNELILKIQSQKEKMYRWGIKFQTVFDLQKSKPRSQVLESYPRKDLNKLIKNCLHKILDFMGDMEKHEQERQKENKNTQNLKDLSSTEIIPINPKQRVFSGRHEEKNTRIKTVSTFEDELKAGQSGALPFEEPDAPYDDQSEIEYLQFNRKAMKKNELNRKFRIKTKPN